MFTEKKQSLYLTKITHLSFDRMNVSQEWLGDDKHSILKCLIKQFTQLELAILFKGEVLEKGSYQFIVTPEKAKELGNIHFTPPKLKRGRSIDVRELHWYEKLKKYRVESGLTQDQVNRKMNFIYNKMSSLELGKTTFAKDERERFFDLIGKPIDETIPLHSVKPLVVKRSKPKPIAEEEEKPLVKEAPKAPDRDPGLSNVKKLVVLVIEEALDDIRKLMTKVTDKQALEIGMNVKSALSLFTERENQRGNS